MKVFYHADNDGKCAAFWVKKYAQKDGDKADYIKINYGIDFPFDIIESGERIYIVDYSILPEEMDRLLEITPNVVWIDHHKSAIERYKNYNKEIAGLRYDGIAGCMLTFIYLGYMVDDKTGKIINEFDELALNFGNLAPMFTKLIADYDVWTFKYGDYTRQFQKGFELYPHDPEDKIWKDLLHEEGTATTDKQGILRMPILERIINDGKTIIAYRKNMMAEYCEHKGFETELNGYKAFAINMAMVGSDDFVIPNVDDYDILIGFSFDGNSWNYSLRSTKIDCADLAATHGGGGHKGAAGFSTDTLILKKTEVE